MSVSVLPEGFFASLLPEKVVSLDTTGVLHAFLSGFQDRSEDLRSYVSHITSLLDPHAGFPIEGSCVSVTFTDNYGLVVTRNVLGLDLDSDPKYHEFVNGSLSVDQSINWMADVLGIDEQSISSVTMAVDPFRTVYTPMLGYLAQALGVITPTSNPSDPRNAQLVESHFSRIPIKGSTQSIEIAGLLSGFDAVSVSPLWSRLSPRVPRDIGLSVNDSDFSETTRVEPTIEPSDFYDPLEYRDGPFYTWSSRLGRLNSENFISQANGSNPYVSWLIYGLSSVNFRGVFNTSSTYNRGDVVVSKTGLTYVAKSTTTSGLPTSFVTADFLMPSIDADVTITTSDSSWLSLGQVVYVEGAGYLTIKTIAGLTLILTNSGTNGNADPGVEVYAGSIISASSDLWEKVSNPEPGTYALSGGLPNVLATAVLSDTVSIAALAEGESNNGLAVVLDASTCSISSITTSASDRSLVTVQTNTPHNLVTGRLAYIGNVVPFEYVGLYEVTVIDDTHFTYSVPLFIHDAGTAADGTDPYVDSGEFVATIFDRLSSLKYRSSFYNIVLAVSEENANIRSVPVRPNPDVISAVNSGSLSAIPPYLPFSGTTQVSGNEYQVDTSWLSNLSAEADVILESVRPSTRHTRRLSQGIIYSGTVTYADYENSAVVFTKTSSTSGTLEGPTYPRTARIFAPDVELVGEYDPDNPDDITFSGSPTYGSVSVNINYRTGVFSAVRPAGFPTSGTVLAQWVVDDSGTIRSEPSAYQKVYGNINFLDRPEDDFGTMMYGSNPTVYPDTNVWSRPLEREVLNRDLEPIYGEEQTFPGEFVTSVESADGITYALYAIDGTYPYQFKTTDLDGRSSNPAIAYSGSSLYRVGLRYGQVLACPERTFSSVVRDSLLAWVPFNTHADDDLAINSVYPTTKALTQTGLLPQDRVWDASRGWVTWMRSCSAYLDTSDLLDEFTFSTWIKILAWSETQEVLSIGLLSVKVSGLNELSVYNNGSLLGSVSISGFSFLSLRLKYTRVAIGVNGAFSAWTISPPLYPSNAVYFRSSSSCQYYIQDFKLWSAFKTDAHVLSIYQPSLVSTQVATSPTMVEVATTGDRWSLRVLSSGFVTVDFPPPSTLVEVTGHNYPEGGTTTVAPLGTITQYPGNLLAVAAFNLGGRFIADSRRHTVGLPGGSITTSPRHLGEALFPISANNKAIYSPDYGLPSGINTPWEDDTSVGNIRVVMPPYSGTGGVESTENTGVTTNWPNCANNTNPLTDRIWISGDDGRIYEVQVGGGTLEPAFNVTQVGTLEIDEIQSGAISRLTDGVYTLSVNSFGTIYSTGTSETLYPRTYLYRHASVVFRLSGLSGWIPTENSEALSGNPSLDTAGDLMWSSDATLSPGHYRLRVKSFNAGRASESFKGFDTEIIIGQDITFPLTLASNQDEDESTHDFYVDETLDSPCLVQVYWGGVVNDPARGISYRLVITEVQIDRLSTQAYRVDPGPTLTEIPTSAENTTVPSSLPPGGWLASIASSGSLDSWSHEANIYPTSDSAYTLSEVLTMSSEEKVSKVMVSPDYTGPTVLSDPPLSLAPSISSYTQLVTPSSTPIQVGYNLAISVVAERAMSYIWNFWDGSIRTTYDPSTEKTINQGGTLAWMCTAADQYGQSAETTGTIVVNYPPVIHSALLSANDLPPTYSTTLTTLVSDPYSTSPLLVWLDGLTPVSVSTLSSGTTEGTAGFMFNVASSTTKVLHVVDVNGGTTLLDIETRSTPSKPILASITSTPPRQRIGSSAGVRFICRASNPNGSPSVGEPTFLWEFLTIQGWVTSDFSGVSGFSPVSGGYSSPGVSTITGSSYQNYVFVPSVSNQTSGTKLVKLTITPPSGYGSQTVVYGRVTLIENHAPVIERFDVSPETIIPGEFSTVLAVVTDEDGDTIQYDWMITNCSNAVQNGINTNPVVVYPTGTLLTGTLTVNDQFGGVVNASIPSVIITSATRVDGRVGESLTYIPRAMSATSGTFEFDSIPNGLTLVNGTVLGTPTTAGTTQTYLSVESLSGSDRRGFTWAITVAPVAPLTPTNLTVNGSGNNPRYQSGDSITAQWTLTNDGLGVPGSIVELRTFDGLLMKSIELSSGTSVLSLTPQEVLNIFGTYQDIVVRVYSIRNSVRSTFPAECIVTYV